MESSLSERIRAARGKTAPDIVLKGGRVVNVFTGEILEADVAVLGDRIVGVGDYDGPRVMDVRGRWLAPGFIEGHIHVESTLLSPSELTKSIVARGTTTIIADPHEIANVMGPSGIEFILEDSEGMPADVFVMLPSCVPATHLETSGATLKAGDLLAFKGRNRVIGLGEMMNFPGVLFMDRSVLEKIDAFCDRIKDGHAPLLSGRDLNAYLVAGLRSDHETTNLDEAREKLRLGMHVMIREGTQAKNLKTLLPIVSALTASRCSLVTDDLHPHDLLEKGHLDYLIDRAVGEGLDEVLALRMVTLSTAEYFRLHDRGAIAPGYRADLVVLESLTPVKVFATVKNGEVVYREGTLTRDLPPRTKTAGFSQMNIKSYGPDVFAVRGGNGRIRVIGLIPDQILTSTLTEDAKFVRGRAVSDRSRDILKIAVVERHHGTGNIGLGFVKGFGLKKGALASSVAHDSHNMIAVGCSDDDLYLAVKTVEMMKGGIAVAADGEVRGRLPLPIAGLMSGRPLREVADGWKKMRETARDLGCTLKEPFMALSFLALPVIPELKMSDRGLVDVGPFVHVPLFVG